MASYSYPPWSAPASLKKDRDKSSWWRNAKKALKKPWTRKQRSKDHRKTKSTDSTPVVAPIPVSYNPYNVFSPGFQERRPTYPSFFQPHFSPSNVFQNQPRFSNYDPRGFTPFDSHTPQTDIEPSTPGTFEPPNQTKPNRPLLKDVFPIYDSPKLLKPAQNPAQNPAPRRHSTGGVYLPNPSRRPLRSSDQSVQSDGIARHHRRDIRGGMRVIPILPQRQDDHYRQLLSISMQQKDDRKRHGLEYDEPDSAAHSSGNQQHNKYAPTQDRTLYNIYNQAYSPYGNREGPHSNPQSSKQAPGGFSYQQVPPQNKTLLQELEDEIEGEGGDSEESYEPDFATQLRPIKEEDTGDEIKGFDGFMMY